MSASCECCGESVEVLIKLSFDGIPLDVCEVCYDDLLAAAEELSTAEKQLLGIAIEDSKEANND